jgi:hypothetical protein
MPEDGFVGKTMAVFAQTSATEDDGTNKMTHAWREELTPGRIRPARDVHLRLLRAIGTPDAPQIQLIAPVAMCRVVSEKAAFRIKPKFNSGCN